MWFGIAKACQVVMLSVRTESRTPCWWDLKKKKGQGGGGHDDIWQGGKEKLSKQEVSEFDFSRQVGSQTVTAFSL